jgi:hypothetical protein
MNKALKAIAKAHSTNLRKSLNLASDLRRLYQNEKQYFALGGSLALKWMNLLNRTIGDVDIMVSDRAESFITFVKAYNELMGNVIIGSGSGSPDANDELDVKEHLTLVVKDRNVCVFVMTHDNFLKYTAVFNNIVVAKPDYIRTAKEVYLKRVKNQDTYDKHYNDIRDINKGIKSVFKQLM